MRREAFGGAGDGPCNYAGGGLFAINPQAVIDEEGREQRVFAFAEPVAAAAGGAS